MIVNLIDIDDFELPKCLVSESTVLSQINEIEIEKNTVSIELCVQDIDYFNRILDSNEIQCLDVDNIINLLIKADMYDILKVYNCLCKYIAKHYTNQDFEYIVNTLQNKLPNIYDTVIKYMPYKYIRAICSINIPINKSLNPFTFGDNIMIIATIDNAIMLLDSYALICWKVIINLGNDWIYDFVESSSNNYIIVHNMPPSKYVILQTRTGKIIYQKMDSADDGIIKSVGYYCSNIHIMTEKQTNSMTEYTISYFNENNCELKFIYSFLSAKNEKIISSKIFSTYVVCVTEKELYVLDFLTGKKYFHRIITKPIVWMGNENLFSIDGEIYILQPHKEPKKINSLYNFLCYKSFQLCNSYIAFSNGNSIDIVDIDTGHLSTVKVKGNRVNFIDNKLIILQFETLSDGIQSIKLCELTKIMESI